jgi:hypothetical protein
MILLSRNWNSVIGCRDYEMNGTSTPNGGFVLDIIDWGNRQM